MKAKKNAARNAARKQMIAGIVRKEAGLRSASHLTPEQRSMLSYLTAAQLKQWNSYSPMQQRRILEQVERRVERKAGGANTGEERMADLPVRSAASERAGSTGYEETAAEAKPRGHPDDMELRKIRAAQLRRKKMKMRAKKDQPAIRGGSKGKPAQSAQTATLAGKAAKSGKTAVIGQTAKAGQAGKSAVTGQAVKAEQVGSRTTSNGSMAGAGTMSGRSDVRQAGKARQLREKLQGGKAGNSTSGGNGGNGRYSVSAISSSGLDASPATAVYGREALKAKRQEMLAEEKLSQRDAELRSHGGQSYEEPDEIKEEEMAGIEETAGADDPVLAGTRTVIQGDSRPGGLDESLSDTQTDNLPDIHMDISAGRDRTFHHGGHPPDVHHHGGDIRTDIRRDRSASGVRGDSGKTKAADKGTEKRRAAAKADAMARARRQEELKNRTKVTAVAGIQAEAHRADAIDTETVVAEKIHAEAMDAEAIRVEATKASKSATASDQEDKARRKAAGHAAALSEEVKATSKAEKEQKGGSETSGEAGAPTEAKGKASQKADGADTTTDKQTQKAEARRSVLVRRRMEEERSKAEVAMNAAMTAGAAIERTVREAEQAGSDEEENMTAGRVMTAGTAAMMISAEAAGQIRRRVTVSEAAEKEENAFDAAGSGALKRAREQAGGNAASAAGSARMRKAAEKQKTRYTKEYVSELVKILEKDAARSEKIRQAQKTGQINASIGELTGETGVGAVRYASMPLHVSINVATKRMREEFRKKVVQAAAAKARSAAIFAVPVMVIVIIVMLLAGICMSYISEEERSGGSGLGWQIVAEAKKHIGLPYVYGGTSLETGCDCSGFVWAVYNKFGYNLPRTAGAQYEYGRKISSDVNDWQPGDLIYYSRTGSVQSGGGRAEHIVIYIGGGQVISCGPVKILNWDYRSDYYGTCRIIPDEATGGDFSGSTNEEITWNYFISKGFSPEATAGILGNMYVESAGTFDPSIHQIGGGPGRGLCQWEESYSGGSGRYNDLVAYASGLGISWDTMEAQLQFVSYELDSGKMNPYFSKWGGVEAFRNCSDVYTAVYMFLCGFEYCGDPGADFLEANFSLSTRVSHAQWAYQNYS